MRSLTVKLTLAFLIVSLASVALVGLAFANIASSEFGRFLVDRGQNEFTTAVKTYYKTYGSWAGVAEALRQQGLIPNQSNTSSLPGPLSAIGQPPGDQPPQLFVLVDQTGLIVVGGGPFKTGDTMPAAQLKDGQAVTVNGQTVGTIVATGSLPQQNLPETQFLTRLRQSLWLAALAAGALALLLGIVLARTITHPVRELTAAAHAMAQGQLNQRVPVRSKDEIGRLTATLNDVAEQLQTRVATLEQRNREINTLSEQSRLLQACLTAEEAYAILSRLGTTWLPGHGGAVFMTRASRNLLEIVAEWGEWHGQRAFAPEDSWALRTGTMHLIGDAAHQTPLCPHVGPPLPKSYLSVPLAAQGETLGLLHLQGAEGAFDEKRAFVQAASEQLGLGLGNLKLRETLRHTSIRDPLTGLYNRRYMEEMLTREIARCHRNGKPLAALMLDIDQFKAFNDTEGHTAGDVVLQKVAEAIQAMVRAMDIPCRYGGEEILVILPEVELEGARLKAEAIRRRVSELQATFQGRLLAQITVSIGVAAGPAVDLNGEALVQAADTALYAAKHAGRNRVMTAPEPPRLSPDAPPEPPA